MIRTSWLSITITELSFRTFPQWFIHKSVHPISFGIGSVLRKPVVIGNEIIAREVLNMTVLVDHDVIDGAPMVRFPGDLTESIENGKEIDLVPGS